MRNKSERERLEGLLAEIHADTHEASSEGEVCLSPMLGETIDAADNTWTSEGDEYDELST
ncbi:MAG: hypothetical protein GC179_12425 [Anaerolineaceae bacterium]|nr:hypothetical protein [Anaerolineaceae bacterium]